MHPHLLHARTAAWSLTASRQRLTKRASTEAEQITAEQQLHAADGLRSTVYGTRTSSGGHGDPTLALALHEVDPVPRVNRWQQLADNTTDTLRWLADTLNTPTRNDPLTRLQAAIPHLLPGTAANLHRWLTEADQRIRGPLQMPPDLWALPGNPDCPACRLRTLYAQTSGPGSEWTVVCRAGCVCTGAGCPCHMPVTVEGVAHIWDRTAPFVAAALASATRPGTIEP